MIGYDLDHGLPGGFVPPEGTVVITGRVFAQFDARCREVAQQVPLYLRGVGIPDDPEEGAVFISEVIHVLGVTIFYTADKEQADIIREHCPWVEVIGRPK